MAQQSGSDAPAGKEQAGEQQQGGNGASQPSDAIQPFIDAVVAAAKTAGDEPAGDPNVSRVVNLGWLMEDVLNNRAQTPYPAELGLGEQAGRDAQAIWLEAAVSDLKLDASADPKSVVDALMAGNGESAAMDWEPKLAGALLGADARFAKAYGVGRHLNKLGNTERPSPDLFNGPAIDETLAALDDLSTALPPHAARGIANSLRRWKTSQTIANAGALNAQCELWRTILTGEKKATELLEPENYLDAAERLAVKLRATATSLLKQHAFWVVVVVALFLGGVAILVFVPKDAGTTAAGLSGVLAALGLSWKGIGGTLGNVAAKVEAPLWGAEVDGAVTDAITLATAVSTTEPLSKRRRDIKTGDYAKRAARAQVYSPQGSTQPDEAATHD
ncbi:MAG: hypothetical protein ABSG43_15275 [Solirubrobacteraceae bacterium]|jgi:hypothetical protein